MPRALTHATTTARPQAQHIGLRRLAGNYVVLSGAEAASKVLAALAFAYLARVLGPTGYGQLEFVLAIMMFLTLLVDGGLSPFAARETARSAEVVPTLVPQVVLLRSTLAIGAFVLLAVLVLVADQPAAIEELLLLYGVSLFLLPWLLQWAFQGRDLMRFVAAASVLRWSLFAGGVFLLVHRPAELWRVPVVEAAALVCVGAYWMVVTRGSFGWPRLRLDTRSMLTSFRQALPLGASEVAWVAKMYSGTVLLGLLLTGGPEVGWFGGAHRLIVALHTFVFLYFFNLLPSLTRAAEQSPTTLARLLRPSLQVSAWLGLLLGGLGVVLAEPAMLLLYGTLYHDAAPPLQVLVWLLPLALLSGHYRYALIASRRQGLELVSALCGAAAAIGLSLVLIPPYGAVGAAWALVASEAVILVVAFAFMRPTVDAISPLSWLPRPLVAGALLLATLYALQPLGQIWAIGAGALVVYAASLSALCPRLLMDVRAFLANSRA